MPASEDIETGQQDAEPAANLGVRLRRAREAQDISIETIAAELRISVPALTALEECRFEALGPPVFARGYLKQYGARLGLDVAGLLAEYQRIAGDDKVEIAPSKTIRLRDERQVAIWIVAAIGLVLAAAILAVWWWLGRDAVPDAIADAAATSAPAIAETEADPPAAASEPEPAPRPAARTPAEIAPETEPPASSQVLIAQTTTSAETAAVEAVEAVEAAEAVEAFTGPTLEIFFFEDSWADITAATGERLYYALGLAGTRATVPADRDLDLFFGNAAGVELRIEGEPFPIPASARRGDLAQFRLEARTGRNR
jgi:cytoskeleton protein RodZ